MTEKKARDLIACQFMIEANFVIIEAVKNTQEIIVSFCFNRNQGTHDIFQSL